MAGDQQWNRIARHGLADIARGFRAGAEFLRQRAIRRGFTPADTAKGDIDPLAEVVLRAELERKIAEVDLSRR